ncbi:hypothetical protein ACU686_30855 [Yinghuangia aomiensis]
MIATTGSERGLNLRSPGRFLAPGRPAARAVPGARQRLTRCCATPRCRRGWTPRRTACSPSAPVTKLLDGGQIGADSSINKVFWSQMDVELHALRSSSSAATAELDEGSLDGRGRRRTLARRLPLLRSAARSTRAPTRSAQHHRRNASSACPGPSERTGPASEESLAMRLAYRKTRLFRETVRDFLEGACTTDKLREAWAADTAITGRWTELAKIGVTGLVVPRGAGRPRSDRRGLARSWSRPLRRAARAAAGIRSGRRSCWPSSPRREAWLERMLPGKARRRCCCPGSRSRSRPRRPTCWSSARMDRRRSARSTC